MDKKELQKDMGYKLRKIRETSKHRPHEMASFLGTWPSTYTRYEKGETAFNLIGLYRLAEQFNISLDWFVRNKGAMYVNETVQNQKTEIDTTGKNLLSILGEDVRELLEYMVHNKLLRYEILVHFQKFKEKNKPPIKTTLTES